MTEGHTPDLIERIEGATGPDRDIDYAIFCAITPNDGRGYWYPQATANLYTASIDAAMMLVPEGWNGSIDWIGDRCGAVLNKTAFVESAVMADAATPALALCAASLKARAIP